MYVKYFGLYLDKNLDWNYNLNQLYGKLNRGVGILSKVKHYLHRDILKSFYY